MMNTLRISSKKIKTTFYVRVQGQKKSISEFAIVKIKELQHFKIDPVLKIDAKIGDGDGPNLFRVKKN